MTTQLNANYNNPSYSPANSVPQMHRSEEETKRYGTSMIFDALLNQVNSRGIDIVAKSAT